MLMIIQRFSSQMVLIPISKGEVDKVNKSPIILSKLSSLIGKCSL